MPDKLLVVENSNLPRSHRHLYRAPIGTPRCPRLSRVSVPSVESRNIVATNQSQGTTHCRELAWVSVLCMNYLLIQRKSPPERGRLYRKFVFVSFIPDAMQPHFDGQSNTLTRVIPTFRVSAAAGLPNRHDAKRLDRGQSVVVSLLIEEPLRLLEEVITGRVWVIGVRACHGLRRESTAQSK